MVIIEIYEKKTLKGNVDPRYQKVCVLTNNSSEQ